MIRGHCSPENITHKYQMSSIYAACTPINCPKDLQKYDIYTYEEGMCKLLFSSQQPKAKDFGRHCCNVLFPHREYENVGLQDEIRAKDQHIAALQRCYVGYLSDEDKNNGISIIAKKNDEAEYLYISIYGQHGYRRHKIRMLLTRNKG